MEFFQKSVKIQTYKWMLIVPSYKSIILLLVGFTFLNFLQANGQSVKIQKYLQKIDSSAELKQASWGFCLLSGKTGKQITEFKSNKSLVPASVQKIITTSAALAILGDTFRFKTQIFYAGKIENGQLKGDLIVKGFGNPVLGSQKGSQQNTAEIIEEFVGKIQKAGIKEIQGKLIADVSYFEYEPVPAFWTWYDIGNYYAPQIGALNIAENQFELLFAPGKKAGDSSKFIKATPAIEGLKIVNHTTTVNGGGDQTFIPGPPRSMEKHIYGKIPAGESFKVKGAIPQPEIFFLKTLKAALSKEGIKSGEITVTYSQLSTQNPQLIHTNYSQSISQICQYANYTSNNLTAECLLRTLGAEKKNEGSTQAGLDVVQEFLKTRVGKVNGLKQVDGSGLSKYNLINASQLATYLFSISKEPWSKCFINTLPTSGTNGTLERFCDGANTTGRVFAKSGSMERIKCYAGYVKDKQGNLNPFAILVNNHDVQNREIVKLIEGLMELCVE
ncbi:MAG: D-alanyl-D-alanine carboxypeptidase/D-alanyl-D-alanine-endopeptidase [Opitutaceae bacterium]|nr:D-alanyl-D-alanine carboxypeptidase/D-alanyl-D-alanine-endopeptidase [Cytophagales bacterium]